MERRKKDKKNKKKVPRVPIKTYKWEDIRRARLKGGYPWTHLYKEPFNEQIDLQLYTMDKVSKKSNTLSIKKSSDSLQIEEVTNGRDSLTPEPSGYIVITEVPSDSENHSKEVPGSSVTIEDVVEAETLNLESAESSDNISQYLDKEEPTIEVPQPKKVEEEKTENGREERAKSEEPKKKRKLSIDSSYSRKSLSKLAIMKKLKDAKDKIKVPKLSLPKLPSLPDLPQFKNPLKQENPSKSKKESETKEPTPKDVTRHFQANPNAKPVYIHIPLKPPEGQTDEFSYLEFGEEKPEEPQKKEETQKTPDVMPTIEVSFNDERRFSGDPNDIVAFEILKAESIDLDEAENNGLQANNEYLIIQQDDDAKSETRSMIIIMPSEEPALSRQGSKRQTPTRQDSKKQKAPSRQGSVKQGPSRQGSVKQGPSRQGSVKQGPSRQGSRKVRAKSAEPERKRKLSADSSHSRRSLSKLGILKRLKDARDKIKSSFGKTDSKKPPSTPTKDESAEPQKTKTEPQKTHASSNEPKYIHIPLKPPPGQTDEFSYLEFEEKKEDTVPQKSESGINDKQSSVESPASSPQNEGVQFIFLTPPSDDEILDKPDVPETPSSEDKVFFSSRIHELKEIAKDAVDKMSPESRRKLQTVVEENSSETGTQQMQESDDSKEEKPKEVQSESTEKSATDESKTVEKEKREDEHTEEEDDIKKETTKKSKKKKSKPKADDKKVKTDIANAKQEIEEISEKEQQQEVSPKVEKMVVDEEDGLKLTESAMAKQEQNIKAKEVEEPCQDIKSSFKSDGSPVLKKKVAFKRRSKDDSKDGDYEEIQAPEDDNTTQKIKAADETTSKLVVMGNSQSMSVDEEKSYLDEKIIKSTSLEEDYNRWSKLSDHDYEPINPPPDNASPISLVQSSGAQPATTQSPSINVIDTDRGVPQKTTSLASSTTSLERRMLGTEDETSPGEALTVQEMQTEIENKYFNKPTEAKSKPATIHTITTITKETKNETKKPEGPGKFQKVINIQKDKIKTQTDKFRTKLHEIRKPNIKLPSKPQIKKPNLERFKFEKPKFNLPKIPDTTRINLPTFSLPRRSPLKRSLKQRQLSTESNAGGSKKNYFDFRTYPRLFKKKPKDDFDSFSSKSERETQEFATVPRTKRNKGEDDRWGGRDSIRISLHAEDSIESEEREDSVERRMASHMRYEQDIDIDDAYEKENQEIHAASPFSHDYNSRWNHGSFHPDPNREFQDDSRNKQVTDLDSPEDESVPQENFEINTGKDIHSSESSLGIHRRGVLEEIDSDEFFLRQKGISQDNIEVGMYLSSEIREAFKSPSNALADLQKEPLNYPYDDRASNQSLPQTPTKRKIVKKPKRKKTPHVSQEQISFDQDSEPDNELPPSRPKRRSKRSKKQKDPENVIPYQETIAVDVPEVTVGILQVADDHEQLMYENEQMQGKEQPEIKIIDPYSKYEEKYDSEEEVFKEEDTKPSAPPRKQRSLKSLNYSEHDSILDVSPDREAVEKIETYKTEHEYIIPTPELPESPPVKPPRTLSRSSSKSRENEEIDEQIQEVPIAPTRTRPRSKTRSRNESLTAQEPCVEEPCVQDIRDSMGYAVIDKHTRRDPPLPPPRTPPRLKKLNGSDSEQRFFTVPRTLNDEPPVRPVRNYSTLGPSRPPRKKHPVNMTDEEKENIDITQYIEIDEEPARDLISGEVIQKMRDRPLPAPPRPPRKTRPFHDITSQENIPESVDNEQEKAEVVEEAEVSTQTEPLPEDFECEDVVERKDIFDRSEALHAEQTEPVVVEKRLITPTHYTYEQETITHGSLVVQPLDGARILPESELTRRESPTERTVPISKEYEDETSEIPEEFTKFKDPERVQEKRDTVPAQSTPAQPSVVERIIERPVVIQPDSSSEIEVLKAQKLQVSDLDVDRLSVNELLASKIIVSEIDSGNIQTNEISSKSGALKVGEIELPPAVIQQLFEKLQSVAQEQQGSGSSETKPVTDPSTKEETDETGQKKTPIEGLGLETLPPQRPPRKSEELLVAPVDNVTDEPPEEVHVEPLKSDSHNESEIEEIHQAQGTEEPPEPPIRTDSSEIHDVQQEEEIPQRPPRHVDKSKTEEVAAPEALIQGERNEFSSSEQPKQEPPSEIMQETQRLTEPEIDDEPPPRPPEPQIDYIPSQPPPSFYAMRAQQYVDDLEGDIPMIPRRRRHHKPPISRSSSDDSPAPPPSRRRYRSPEPSIPQLTGQLLHACGSAANDSIKRLMAYITNKVLRNSDGQQDLHVIICILLILIAGLILLGYGDGKTVHYHHWEFFNPPRDI